MPRRPRGRADLDERILATEARCAAAVRDHDPVAEWLLVAELWALYEQRERLTSETST